MNTLANLAELSALTNTGPNPIQQLAGILQLVTGMQGMQFGQQEQTRADRRLTMDEENQRFSRDLATRGEQRADKAEGRADRQLTLAQLGQEQQTAFQTAQLRNQERGIMQEGRRTDIMEANVTRQAEQGQAMTLLGLLESLSRFPGQVTPGLLNGLIESAALNQGIALPSSAPDPKASYLQNNIPGFSGGQPIPTGY